MNAPINDYWNRPCAAYPYKSFRYAGRYGWIMIGAADITDALSEASRSTDGPWELHNLQAWDGTAYVSV